MRKSDAAVERATAPLRPRVERASHELVCLALVLALATLLLRIACVW